LFVSEVVEAPHHNALCNVALVAGVPDTADLMAWASRILGTALPVAHNAAFDRNFWVVELARAGRPVRGHAGVRIA
jgi:hypothetical protein